MTKQLYEEALADVKKLKEVAEDNAKKALIEAVAPRIKDLIEAELLREVDHTDSVENPVDDGLLMDDMDGYPLGKPAGMSSMESGVNPASVTLDLSSLTDFSSPDDEMYAMPGADEEMMEPEAELRPVMPDQLDERIINLKKKISRVGASISTAKNTSFHKLLVAEMVSNVEGLYKSLQESVVVDNKQVYENILEKMYKDLNKLTERTMTKNRLHEKSMSVTFDGLPDELSDEDLEQIQVKMTMEDDEGGGDEASPESEEGPLDLDSEGEDESPDAAAGDEGEDEEAQEPSLKEGRHVMNAGRLSDNTIVEIDEGMLRREITKMKALREAADDVQSWGHGAGDLGDLEDEVLGDPLDMDLGEDDLTESTDMDETVIEIVNDDDEGVKEGPDAEDGADPMNEMDLDEEEDLSELSQADDVAQYGGNGSGGAAQGQLRQAESIRRRLAAEQRLQTEVKKAATKKAATKKAATKNAAAKTAAAKKAKMQGRAKDAKKLKEAAIADHRESLRAGAAYDSLATKFNESVHRAARLRSMLNEVDSRNGSKLNGGSTRSAEGAEILRNKLAETNLFNTKLLYTNKLLQNESLTKRQKADVIERLDEAKTEREVKLVYESLVKTLTHKSSNLSEGAQRVIGSSSAPTRSASTVLNEGFEADRWAKLAGIK